MTVEFDSFAANYDEALDQGLTVSGESKLYFARGRIAWLAVCLERIGFHAASVLDYGCGTGTSIPYFFDLLNAKSVIGLDISQQSLDIARLAHGNQGARFHTIDQYACTGTMDLVFCNGVLHHVPPLDRPAVVRYIGRCLRPGGVFALWENNPWNPGTRWVMSRIPFDRDAITLTACTAVDLVRQEGFEVLRTDYLFVFPRFLRLLRPAEHWLSRLPFGAQYQVLCRKPEEWS